MSMLVSVIVPTYRRPVLLDRCLAALRAQTLDPVCYEIIVVDDGADLATRQVVERWRKRHTDIEGSNGRSNGHSQAEETRPGHAPELHYVAVRGARHGPAVARNLGWRAARGQIVAFTDDDCVPEPGWLQAGLAAFTDGVCGAAGKLVVPLSERPTDYERNVAQLQQARFVTANCFYRRGALAAVDGFDERFTMAWREDSDLYFALLEQHNGRGRFEHVPDAVVVHPVRPASWGVSLWQQRQNLFNALLYKKHPLYYRQILRAAPPWHYYRAVIAMLLALALFRLGKRRAAGLAVVVWLWEINRFCRRRLQETRKTPGHVLEMIVTSILIPPLSVFWRLCGAVKFRVFFF